MEQIYLVEVEESFRKRFTVSAGGAYGACEKTEEACNGDNPPDPTAEPDDFRRNVTVIKTVSKEEAAGYPKVGVREAKSCKPSTFADLTHEDLLLYRSVAKLLAMEDLRGILEDEGYSQEQIERHLDLGFADRWLDALNNNECIAECRSLAAAELLDEILEAEGGTDYDA